MTQRLLPPGAAYNDRPFEGQGLSLYVTPGDRVQYRNLRLLATGRRRHGRRRRAIKGSGGVHNLAAASVLKTARVAHVDHPETEISYPLPELLASQTVLFDVRHFRDDVENTSDNYRVPSVPLDAELVPVDAILGTATLLDTEIRAGGVCRLRFRYVPSRDGRQPQQFRAVRTAGPSSPANVTITARRGEQIHEIATPALLDSGPYTYKIQALHGGTISDILSGIVFTPDATGPAAPTSATAEAW